MKLPNVVLFCDALRAMLSILLTAPVSLVEFAAWVFSLVVPVVWLDHQFKARLALRSQNAVGLVRAYPVRSRSF